MDLVPLERLCEKLNVILFEPGFCCLNARMGK